LLTEITPSDCRKVVIAMAEKNLCGGSINKVIKLMKMFFRTAQQDGLIENDPVETLKRATEYKTVVRPFTFDEVLLILKTCKEKYPHLFPFLCTFAFTGMRPNELYALKWVRIDLDGGIITITEGRVLGRDTLPKTVGSQRHVNIIPALEKILREHANTPHVSTDYVFTNTKGTPLCEQVARRMWHKILDDAGIEKRRLYELRHTFATQAIALGENPSWVSAMLGHSDAQITFRKYNRYVKNLTRQDGSVLQQKYEELGNL
jgi:integrase